MMLTSTKNTDKSVDFPILDTKKSGLLKDPTYYRLSKLFTASEKVVQKLGELPENEMDEVISKVIDFLEAGIIRKVQ